MRKWMAGVVVSVVGFGLPLGAWAGERLLTPGQAAAQGARGAQAVQLPAPGAVPDSAGEEVSSQDVHGTSRAGAQVAQPPQAAPGQRSGMTASGMTTIDQRELDYLHHRLGQLEQQNAQLRAEVQRAHPAQGIGGSGPSAARAVIVGTVKQVSRQQVALVDKFGTVYNLKIASNTEAMVKGQPVPLDRIRQGEDVRAQFDLVNGSSVARRLEVLPPQPAPQRQAPPQPAPKPAQR